MRKEIYLFILFIPCFLRAIVNGTDTSEYHAVYKVISMGICTGSAISPSLLVTAAHCIRSTDNTAIGVELAGGNKVSSVRVFVAEDASVGKQSLTLEDASLDLAIGIFPDNSFGENYLPLASRPAGSGKLVTMVGFGRGLPDDIDTNSPTRAGIKRVGRNKITRWQLSGSLLETIGILDSEAKDNAVVAFGDSGGPMYNVRDEQVGVASVFHFGEESAIAYHVNLLSKASQKLIAQVKEARPLDFSLPNKDSALPKPAPHAGGAFEKSVQRAKSYEFSDGWRLEWIFGGKGRLNQAIAECQSRGWRLLRSGYFNKDILKRLGLNPEVDQVYFDRGAEPAFRDDPFAIIWYPKDSREGIIKSVDRFDDGSYLDGKFVCMLKVEGE